MQKKIPTRKCVGCGEMKDKRELVRVIKTPEDEILLDTTGRANGRGAYICNNIDCFKKALKNKGLERSLKAQIPEDVLDKLSKEFGE
ncbi:YlxR family protein [Butyrivibrio sp. XB500-5]|uniref:RNase P modulator RnpM n=1 Tax=Butyrivibrio sp. XB500-5 TaxID=2364880 RepID=UPI000EAA6E61|nr:YlxR family protein [Butyrivibrio sp. XB500-5]RKM62863.1 YlxR family protein [Butyrivibrio sp. XB500-5]